jgi:hypothetical protein
VLNTDIEIEPFAEAGRKSAPPHSQLLLDPNCFTP